VYNPDERLARALRSVSSQTMPPSRVHIRDDASTNGFALASLADVVAQGSWHAERNPQNLGMFNNFLRVLLDADGEFFAFLAQDDQWQPAFLETLSAALIAHPQAVVAFCASRYVRDGAVIETFATPQRGVVEHRQLSLLISFFRGHSRLNNAIYYGLWRREALVELMRHIESCGLEPNEKLPVTLGILSGRAVSVPDELFVKDHGRRRGSRGPGGDLPPGRYVRSLVPAVRAAISCILRFRRASLPLRLAAVVGELWRSLRKVSVRLRRSAVR
jgi:glycosyltransferase involved in cell wall biosynthesis